jgi:hypothetical protein
LLYEIAGSYSEITDMLTAFRKRLKASAGEELRYNCVDTKISYEAAFRNE